MMALLIGDFLACFGFGGLIDIFDEGGDASNREKRRNISEKYQCLSLLGEIIVSSSFPSRHHRHSFVNFFLILSSYGVWP